MPFAPIFQTGKLRSTERKPHPRSEGVERHLWVILKDTPPLTDRTCSMRKGLDSVARRGGQAGQCRVGGGGAGRGAGSCCSRPSQDVPDASVGSVCIRGDQDSGGRTACPCWLGLEEAGRVGGSFWELGLPAGPGMGNQHLLHLLPSPRSLGSAGPPLP